MEDFVTWVDTSKLKRTVMAYNDEVSPFLSSMILLTGPSSTTSICCESSLLYVSWKTCKSTCYPCPMADFARKCTSVSTLCCSVSVFARTLATIIPYTIYLLVYHLLYCTSTEEQMRLFTRVSTRQPVVLTQDTTRHNISSITIPLSFTFFPFTRLSFLEANNH